jgi:restriction endonuclease Mrr
MGLRPDAFERLARRLLREADFDSVNVTGQSGDGGIDGLGVYRLGLVSFPVFFQCKRYRGSVGPGAVRDFRGAMTGRGDKGLLITTGSFTARAPTWPTVTRSWPRRGRPASGRLTNRGGTGRQSRAHRPGFAIGDHRAVGGFQPFPAPWIFRLGTFRRNAVESR